MSDLLIIGSEGFIGRNIVSFYSKKGWKILGVDRLDNPSFHYSYTKLLNLSELAELLSRTKFSYVINAAGSGNVGFSIGHPFADFESNCFETAKILEAMRLADFSGKYLHISSAAVYGNPFKLPIKEMDPTNPASPYGWHKLMSEMLCREYCELYKLKSGIIRPFSVYGPGLRKQLFWDIYNKSLNGSNIELFGTGNETRDFIYIDDLLKAIDLLLLHAPMAGENYNVANGFQISIREVADEFLTNFGGDFRIIFNGQVKKGDPVSWEADISKLEKFGYKPEISIKQGLKFTYDWIKHNNPNISVHD